MLAPETRTLLSDSLRPPEGMTLDVAVATTYSLDLTTLLLAPLSFALFDYESDDGADSVNPLLLLESISRYSDKVTVFAQAGAISVPSGSHHRLFPFIEGSIVEVGIESGLFHPKVWVLRFADAVGRHQHRILVLSRNLTFDTSWDTVLRLDETVDGPADAGSVADLIERLPDLDVGRDDGTRRDDVFSLAASVRVARFAPPAPFTSLQFLVFGSAPSPRPFPENSDRLLAITPFVGKAALVDLGRGTTTKMLVSRDRTLDELGSKALAEWSVHVLDPNTESSTDEDEDAAVAEVPSRGLHAKTYVFDQGSSATVVTGSVNLTAAALNKNIEVAVSMTGPRSSCGVAAMLDGPRDAPGFGAILSPYTVESIDGELDGTAQLEWEIEAFHQLLAMARPSLLIQTNDDQTADMKATFDGLPPLVGESSIRPISVKTVVDLDDAAGLTWQIAQVNVTPFLAVETTLTRNGLTARRSCVLKAHLTGDVGDRKRDALRSVLNNRDDVIRYLLFLLGDPRYADAGMHAADLARQDSGNDGSNGAFTMNLALLEPLIRAVGRDGDAFTRVAALMEHLRQLPDGEELMPPELQELWDVLWLVHQERVR